jgi:hypothetical protein
VLLYAEDKLTPVLRGIEARLEAFGSRIVKIGAAIGGLGAGIALGLMLGGRWRRIPRATFER